jgi:hypothetical protein
MFSAAAGGQYFLRVRGHTTNAINVYEVGVVEVDLLGPQVTQVGVTGSAYDLFDPKPSSDGPTPLVTSLTISLRDLLTRDLMLRAPGDVYPAIDAAVAIEDGHYRLVGDHNGIIPISNIIVSNNPVAAGQVATATIVLEFAAPLPDDRYTFMVFDTLLDPAGNHLDGESNAAEPQESPQFPTGDGVSGSDFVSRFTVDSRPEIGTFAMGGTYLDINGNFVFDPEGQDNDQTNRDLVFLFGLREDRVFAGNFAPPGAVSASGFDKLGAYGIGGVQSSIHWHWRLDFNHDGVIDYEVQSGKQTDGDPVAGNFDLAIHGLDSHAGDEIGLFHFGKWYLDATGNHNIGEPGDVELHGDMQGLPIAGDFDGDGLDDLGTWYPGSVLLHRPAQFQFDLAHNGLTGDVEQTIDFDVPGDFRRPVAADMNGDGIDDVGLFVGRREGVPAEEAAEWYFLISDDPAPTPGQLTALNHDYSPAPLGNDLFAQFGDEQAAPVAGNFDPPNSHAPGAALPGDLDINGAVDFDDIDDFVFALNDAAAYEDTFGVPATLNGDIDENGLFDFDDIDDFVTILSHGSPLSAPGQNTGAQQDNVESFAWLLNHPQSLFPFPAERQADTDADGDVDFDDIRGWTRAVDSALKAVRFWRGEA